MKKNFKLTIEYDGSRYHGWQHQKNERTIQGELEQALARLTAQPVVVIGSGRTDAGVHAEGQVASFHCDTRLSANELQKGLNSLTPDDIVIKRCEPAAETFHARYDAISKTYRYCILNRAVPPAVGRQYAWWIRKKLDVDRMRLAIDCIIGTHDFKAFEGSGSPRSTTERRVVRAVITKQKAQYLFCEIEADGFLRYMVRNLVGTLADVGLHRITPDDFKDILFSRNRSRAGITAPAKGLFLMAVKYEPA